MSRRWLGATVGMVLGVGLAACASTKVTTTWVAPGARDEALGKIMAIAVMPDSQTRYIVEDELHRQVTRVEVLESYSFIEDDQLRDIGWVKDAIKRSGVDGVIVVRFVATEQETTYRSAAPGPSYGFYGYYNWAWSTLPSYGWADTDTKVSLEFQIFAVEGERRLWSGRSQSTNPASIRSLIIESIAAVRDELRRVDLVD